MGRGGSRVREGTEKGAPGGFVGARFASINEDIATVVAAGSLYILWSSMAHLRVHESRGRVAGVVGVAALF